MDFEKLRGKLMAKGYSTRVFADKRYMRDLANPAFAWMDVGPKDVANGLLAFVSSL